MEEHARLRAGSLSFVEVLAASVALIGLSMTPVLIAPYMFAAAGNASWLAYAFGAVMLLLVAVNLNHFAKRATGAGSMFLYAARELGPATGTLAGWSLIWAYLFVGASQFGAQALFLGQIATMAGTAMPPILAMALLGIACWLLAVRDIALSTIVMLVLETVSVAIICTLVAIVLFKAGPHLDMGQLRLEGAGKASIGLGIATAIFSFVGFESATAFGDEARNPLKTIPRAVVWSVIIAAAFFILAIYAEILGLRGAKPPLDQSSAPLWALAELMNAPYLKTSHHDRRDLQFVFGGARLREHVRAHRTTDGGSKDSAPVAFGGRAALSNSARRARSERRLYVCDRRDDVCFARRADRYLQFLRDAEFAQLHRRLSADRNRRAALFAADRRIARPRHRRVRRNLLLLALHGRDAVLSRPSRADEPLPLRLRRLSRCGAGALFHQPQPNGNGAGMNPTIFDIAALHRRHVLTPWSAQKTLDMPVIEWGTGSYLYDVDGGRYLDLSAGLVAVNLGHGHPDLVRRIGEQAGRLAYASPQFFNTSRAQYAARLSEIAPWSEGARSFFTTGGGEANEDAVKMARAITGRHKVLAAYRSFHGSAPGAGTLTGENRRWPNEPGMPGVVHFFAPNPYRSPFYTRDPEAEVQRAIEHLELVLTYEDAARVAAILLEPVVGTNGAIVYPQPYLQAVREICTNNGILLIFDEVMCGFGRTGAAFAANRFNVEPDLMTFAKGATSAYMPFGGVLIRESLAATFDTKPLPCGHTFSGHPLAVGTALAALDIYERDGIFDRARTIEGWLSQGLDAVAAACPMVGDVRGVGAFWAIELVKDRETRESICAWQGADPGPLPRLLADLRRRGVYAFGRYNVVLITPPLTIERDELDEGLGALQAALAAFTL